MTAPSSVDDVTTDTGRAERLVRTARQHPRELAVALVIVLLPFGDHELKGLSVVYVAMLVPAAFALRTVVRDEQPVPASLILLGLGSGCVIALIAAGGGVNPGDAITRVVIGFITLGYATGIVMTYRPGLEIGATDLVVVVGGIIAAQALSAAGSLTASDGGWVIGGRLTGPFAQPNELGMFCAALLPIAITCVVTSATRRRRVVLAVAALAIAAAWALSMSRGAWIGGAVALACLAVAEPHVRRLLLRAGAALVALCVLALTLPSSFPLLGVLGARLRSLGDPTSNEYDARPLIWGEAWRQITGRPWFGVGPEGYSTAAGDSASTISSYGADHPHDLYLSVLVERGVIGMAAGIIVAAGCALAAWHHLRARATLDDPAGVIRSARGLAVIAGLLAVAVHGVFDLPLRNPILAGLVWTLLGMAIVAELVRPAPRPAPPRPAQRKRTRS